MFTYLASTFVERPKKGRRFAIGDIHGCYRTFKSLLFDRINITPNDQIFLLGDYINRGPKSKKVLNLIIKLIEKGYAIYPLRGNHEEVFLKYLRNDSKYLFVHLKQSRSLDLLNKKFQVRNKHALLLDSLPYYFELDNFFLVHAGFDFSNKKPFDDKTSMVWIRKFKKNINKEITKGKIIVHGHQKTALKKIQKQVINQKKEISLENAVYEVDENNFNFSKFGNLLALNLDSMELIIQPNLDLIEKRLIPIIKNNENNLCLI